MTHLHLRAVIIKNDYEGISHLILSIELISKWPPHWTYDKINTYIFPKQIPFACIKTYQAFLSIANTNNTCSSVAQVQNRSTPKI